MQVLSHWQDEPAFHRADARRRTSPEVDLGATWRHAGSNQAYRLSWLAATGELYLCRADSYDGSCSDVSVLAVVPSEAELDRMLDGWREHRDDEAGLNWLVDRVSPLAVA